MPEKFLAFACRITSSLQVSSGFLGVAVMTDVERNRKYYCADKNLIGLLLTFDFSELLLHDAKKYQQVFR